MFAYLMIGLNHLQKIIDQVLNLGIYADLIILVSSKLKNKDSEIRNTLEYNKIKYFLNIRANIYLWVELIFMNNYI